MRMRIWALKKYQQHLKGGLFSDLPQHARERASRWLATFLTRWHGKQPQWRLAILVGQAKRLALNPPDSAWGRSMRAKRGGRAVQRKYRLEGRHPTEKATRIRLIRQKARKAQEAQPKAQGAQALARATVSPWITPPENVAKAHRPLIGRPNLPPPPSPEARALHRQLDSPGCRCYYCAYPNHDEP
jgi:hypothetical protein